MRSGELAALANVNKETLRFYERKGLLLQPERTPSGYRDYAEMDLQRMVFIKNAQQFGFDLEEIRELLAIADGKIIDRSQVRTIAKRRVNQINQQITLLNKLRIAMKQLILRCSHSRSTNECPIIESLSSRQGASPSRRKKVSELEHNKHRNRLHRPHSTFVKN